MAGYIPNTAEQQREMLSAAGFGDFDSLFADIPESALLHRPLHLPDPMSEPEVIRHLRSLSKKNTGTDDCVCFLGAGAYDHYIPSAVGHLTSRQEFQTAYTPYQPEISQGTLQAIFEFQSLICELTGMGCEVTIVELQDRILPGEDVEVSAALLRAMKKRRIRFLLGAKVLRIDRQDGVLSVSYDQNGSAGAVSAERVLAAAGRKLCGLSPDVAELGVQAEGRAIRVDAHMGSDNDWPVVRAAAQQLETWEIPYEAHILSAHRTPEAAARFAAGAAESGFGVIIAAAGMTLVVPSDQADLAVRVLRENGENAYPIGEIAAGERGVELC